MTLTQWFRAYFFNPVTRSLRRSKKKLSPFVILLITQICTMVFDRPLARNYLEFCVLGLVARHWSIGTEPLV